MKMRILPALIATATTLTALVACDHDEDVGSSIVQNEIEIIIDSSFTITGQTVQNPRVQSRTTMQLLGAINANGFGQISSEIVTQYMSANTIDTTGITPDMIDSLQLMLAIPNGGYIGDSIAPMGLEIYRLNQQLPSPIYSDFDPQGYYDPTPIASKIYTANVLGEPDSMGEYNYRFVFVDLPVALGRELFQAYRDNPASYATPTAFSQIFPGLYIKNSYGSGRIMKIEANSMRLYWHRDSTLTDGTDTTYVYDGNYYSVTPEIVTNNDISYAISPDLIARAQAGQKLLVAPTGMDVQIQFPIKDIITAYNSKATRLTVVNSLTLSIPVEEIANDYSIAPPPNLLMVLTSQKDEFFNTNSVTDNKYSFYAAYDSTNRRYLFSTMRDYFTTMLSESQDRELTEDDYTFTLTPVTVDIEYYSSYSTSFYISSIAPYVECPTMCRLLTDDAQIKFTFAIQSVKF
ncbi:MAG: DUF4270 domain-containing protein [Bacteroidales bacterium]|nr:DUF4270 domain-containing protein [Bacteroidales bacterium]